MLFGPDQSHRAVRGGPVGPFALVVLLHATLRVIADTDVVGVVCAQEHVTEIHSI